MSDPQPGGYRPEDTVIEPEAHEETPPVETEESPERSIAKRKLSVLENPNFRDFAVRFVDRAEYDAILANQALGGKEVFVFQSNPENYGKTPFIAGRIPESNLSPSFSEYLALGRDLGWYTVAEAQTDWHYSLESLRNSQLFLSLLRKAHKSAQEDEDKTQPIRSRTLSRFREYLKEEFVSNVERELTETIEHSLDPETAKLVLSIVRTADTPDDMEEQFRADNRELLSKILDSNGVYLACIKLQRFIHSAHDRGMVTGSIKDNPLRNDPFANDELRSSSEDLRAAYQAVSQYQPPRPYGFVGHEG